MNRRGFIYGLLATPFAALFARFKSLTSYRSRFATGGIVDGKSTVVLNRCEAADFISHNLQKQLKRYHECHIMPLNSYPLTIADSESYQRALARLKPLKPVPWERTEPRTFKYPFGSIPWKPKDGDAG